jgi:hypothetical protein
VITDLLIGLFFGFSGALCLAILGFRRYVQNKIALRRIIADLYHKDLLPEVCRMEGLIDLATREHHHRYADLALKEIRTHKQKILDVIKKHELLQ